MVRTQVFNLSCVFTESGESRFSTTYCGYPKIPRKPNTEHTWYASYSKARRKDIDGDMVIFVGRKNASDRKIKAVPIPFVSDAEHKMYYWRENPDSNMKVSLPDNKQEVFQFMGSVRVYTNSGLLMKMDIADDERTTVFRTENLLFIKHRAKNTPASISGG